MRFNPLLEEISIEGKRLDAFTFCSTMKSLINSEDFLQYIVEVFGYKSEMFIFVVQGLIFKMMNKYLSLSFVTDEDYNDIQMNIINAIFDKMQLFDRGKGKLVSYLHTIIRGEITKWKSKVRTNKATDCNIVDGEFDVAPVNLEVDMKETLWIQKLAEVDSRTGFNDTVYYRNSLWDLIKGEWQ